VNAVPRITTYRGYNPAHRLIGPCRNIGACLEPDLPDGTLSWFDPSLPPRSGAIHLLRDPRIPNYGVMKRLTLGPQGQWLLKSNLPTVRLTVQQIIGPLVLTVMFPGWPLPDPTTSARVNAENAEFKQAALAWIEEETARRRSASMPS
jgi:hypothetical protein